MPARHASRGRLANRQSERTRARRPLEASVSQCALFPCSPAFLFPCERRNAAVTGSEANASLAHRPATPGFRRKPLGAARAILGSVGEPNPIRRGSRRPYLASFTGCAARDLFRRHMRSHRFRAPGPIGPVCAARLRYTHSSVLTRWQARVGKRAWRRRYFFQGGLPTNPPLTRH